MTKTKFTLFNEISLPQLAKLIRRPASALRIILSRGEFNKFRSGKNLILTPALCLHLYNFFELRKQKCHSIKSYELTQALLMKLRKEL